MEIKRIEDTERRLDRIMNINKIENRIDRTQKFEERFDRDAEGRLMMRTDAMHKRFDQREAEPEDFKKIGFGKRKDREANAMEWMPEGEYNNMIDSCKTLKLIKCESCGKKYIENEKCECVL